MSIFRWMKKKDWEYFNQKEFPEIWDYDRPYYQYRICRNTGAVEEFMTHCMGLNPPMYDGSWYKVSGKPVMRQHLDGEWYVSRVEY